MGQAEVTNALQKMQKTILRSYFYCMGPMYLYSEYVEQDIAQVAAGTLNSLWDRDQRMPIRTEAVMSLEASMVPSTHREGKWLHHQFESPCNEITPLQTADRLTGRVKTDLKKPSHN